jgi:hypothetical protein
MGNLTWDT